MVVISHSKGSRASNWYYKVHTTRGQGSQGVVRYSEGSKVSCWYYILGNQGVKGLKLLLLATQRDQGSQVGIIRYSKGSRGSSCYY